MSRVEKVSERGRVAAYKSVEQQRVLEFKLMAQHLLALSDKGL